MGVVWRSTSKVGMARSADGVWVIANYLEAGNMMGEFQDNVLAAGAAATPPPAKKTDAEDRHHKVPHVVAPSGHEKGSHEGSVTGATSMTAELEQLLTECGPWNFKDMVQQYLDQGFSIDATRSPGNMEITHKKTGYMTGTQSFQ